MPLFIFFKYFFPHSFSLFLFWYSIYFNFFSNNLLDLLVASSYLIHLKLNTFVSSSLTIWKSFHDKVINNYYYSFITMLMSFFMQTMIYTKYCQHQKRKERKKKMKWWPKQQKIKKYMVNFWTWHLACLSLSKCNFIYHNKYILCLLLPTLSHDLLLQESTIHYWKERNPFDYFESSY